MYPNAQANSAAAALGTLRAPPGNVIEPINGEAAGLVTVTVPANQTIPVAAAGDFFLVDSCTGMKTVKSAPAALLTIAPDHRPAVPIRSLGQSVKFRAPFQTLQLSNLTANALVVSLLVGFVDIKYQQNPFAAVNVAPLPFIGGLLAPLVRSNNTTPYAAGQVVCGATVATNTLALDPTVPGNTVAIKKIIVWKSSPTLTAASFRLWIFTGEVTPYADAAVFPLTAANLALCIGFVDIPSFIIEDASSTAAIALIGDFELVGATNAVNGSLYLVLTARDVYVPTALETFSIQLSGDAR